VADITSIFRRYIAGELDAIPWSEEGLNPETATIREELLKVNAKGWWSVASQPAVNGIKSNDGIFGWGPRNGFVFQKVWCPYFSWEYSMMALTDIGLRRTLHPNIGLENPQSEDSRPTGRSDIFRRKRSRRLRSFRRQISESSDLGNISRKRV
jgi:hypothetical protein